MNQEETLRLKIGQAIHDAIVDGAPNADYNDSREIDRLVDAVMDGINSHTARIKWCEHVDPDNSGFCLECHEPQEKWNHKELADEYVIEFKIRTKYVKPADFSEETLRFHLEENNCASNLIDHLTEDLAALPESFCCVCWRSEAKLIGKYEKEDDLRIG